ncbi:nuclease-related domain-containing protein [Alteribacter aurantiacus]|uniref:nuclease-related domain-containing protein n=1 Tax=Alteribacter aurantiacus TaxID=254410 RepID=UPI00040F5C5D|nr:nuclease-related domain-containing protein [Alteribacter aurantiacus]
MIIKPLKPSIYLRQLEALKWRLPVNHPKKEDIMKEHGKFYSGYYGERSLLYHLRSFLYRPDLLFYHNVKLKQDGFYFEMDLMILSQRQMTFVETKHFKGILSFDPIRHQFWRKDPETKKIEVYKDPLTQVRSHSHDFSSWLKENQLHYPLTITPYVTLTHKDALIDPELPGQSDIFKSIFRSDQLPFKLRESLNSTKSNKPISKRQLKAISEKIMSSHSEEKSDILQKFGISPNELRKGLRCPACSHIPMIREKNHWLCGACNHKCNPLIESLRDYALLIDEQICHRDMVAFCLLANRNQCSYYLGTLDLPKSGKKKGTVYHLEGLIKGG